jgi:hypothetical protein
MFAPERFTADHASQYCAAVALAAAKLRCQPKESMMVISSGKRDLFVRRGGEHLPRQSVGRPEFEGFEAIQTVEPAAPVR